MLVEALTVIESTSVGSLAVSEPFCEPVMHLSCLPALSTCAAPATQADPFWLIILHSAGLVPQTPAITHDRWIPSTVANLLAGPRWPGPVDVLLGREGLVLSQGGIGS